MHALVVVSHPASGSVSHEIARRVGEGVLRSGSGHSVEIADLMTEGFDPRFSEEDFEAHRGRAARPVDVVAEQARIDRADALVLVFPVYWWAMPALLKGWIDRVFSNGWAYDDSGPKIVKKLGDLPVHLIGIGGADAGTYTRHGYFDSMKTQIDHGIFDYCGAPVKGFEFLLESDSPDQTKNLDTAQAIGGRIFS